MITDYINVIKEIADDKLECHFDTGYVKAGCNGPYNQKDTPIRNTSHWIVIYSILYMQFKEEKYFKIIVKLADFLLEKKNYGCNGAVICQLDDSLKYTNGLIGQAWTIEGLVYAYKTTNDSKYIHKAQELFYTQQFDKKLILWKIVDDNKYPYIDYVYNHQLWFAAAGSMICECAYDSTIDSEIQSFLNNYTNNFGVQPSGIIFHLINHKNTYYSKLKFIIKQLCAEYRITPYWNHMYYLEVCYQLFNLYGFAILKKRYGELPIFKSHSFRSALDCGCNIKFLYKLYKGIPDSNLYGYAYNSPSFEFPFIDKMFNDFKNQDEYEKLLKMQMELTYSVSTKTFSQNTPDSNTLTARIYELSRFFEKEYYE